MVLVFVWKYLYRWAIRQQKVCQLHPENGTGIPQDVPQEHQGNWVMVYWMNSI